MNPVSSLKRPLTVPIDSCKLLVCKKCDKDDVVLTLKTCGCLFCDSCGSDSRDVCISCQLKIEPMMKISFTKEKKCKFYGEKCNNYAEYKCKCIEGVVCLHCLFHIHSKRINGLCNPVPLSHQVDHLVPCQDCKDFIAEYEAIQSGKKICFVCKSKNQSIGECKKLGTEPDLKLIGEEFSLSLTKVNADRQKTLELMKSGDLECGKKMDKLKTILEEAVNNVASYANQCDQKKLKDIHEICVNFRTGSNLRIILEQLKRKKLKLLGGQEQFVDFLRYCRDKESISPMQRVKINQLYGLNEHLDIVDGLLSKSVQVIIGKRSEPFYVMVEKPGTLNKRAKILKDIKKHENKWVRIEEFQVNDIVIICDVHEIDNHRFKRAEIHNINRQNDAIVVLLLDFGFEITIKANAIGKIPDVNIAGQSTCFIAQLIGDANSTHEIPRGSKGIPIAKHLMI
ncbi:uncharacterized protein LOC107360887 [Tetranychus urticae]|uniref:Tudor domain-containing protein n=1 Tax=Tetranychus urticae TaxID=32264 RepID=T1K5I2_TETUR|nr:uncharacterized protein LOC107360887 [Tetranychus urticae]